MKMKAQLIEQLLHEGTMDFIHGGGYLAKRLLIEVPEGTLVVTQDNHDVLHAFVAEKFEGDYVVMGEVEVSKVFVAYAMDIVKAQKEFQAYGGWFKSGMLK